MMNDDIETLQPYSLEQLEAALQLVRDEKAGILDPPPRSRLKQLGLRARKYKTLVMFMGDDENDDDEDEDGDFDPAAEMREQMRALSRRRAELRAAREAAAMAGDQEANVHTDNEMSSASPTPRAQTLGKRKRACPASDGKLTFKFKKPGTKWALRGFGDMGPDTGTAVQPSPGKHSSGLFYAFIDAMGSAKQAECDCKDGFNLNHDANACLLREKKKAEFRARQKAKSRPEERTQWSMVVRPSDTQSARARDQTYPIDDELLPDTLIEDLLGLQKPKKRVSKARAAQQPSENQTQSKNPFAYHMSSFSSAFAPRKGGFFSTDAQSITDQTPRNTPGGVGDKGTTTLEGELTDPAMYYSIIPNIASVQVRKRRRAVVPTDPSATPAG